MNKDPSLSVFKSARSFLYGTFLSRISGMLRDMSLAFYFGSTPLIASFMIAYRFANLLRRLFGESTLQAGFIPYFEQIRGQNEKKGAQFFRDFFFSLFLILLAVVALAEISLSFFIENVASSSDVVEILNLVMIMLPGLIFICLYALDSSLLQCNKCFFLPAIAPVGFNLVWIFTIVFVQKFEITQAVSLLSLGVVFAFFIQWLLTFRRSAYFFMHFLRWKEWFSPKVFSKEVRKLIKPFALGILGVGALQINNALDAVFAKIADSSGPAYLWYSSRLNQVPLALFGIAIASAILPMLSRAIKENKIKQYSHILSTGLKYSISLMLAFTIAIFVLGTVSINLIYGRGDFTQVTTVETIYCLWGYAFGLIPHTLVLLCANGFYAKKEYWIPMWASIFSVLLNILLNSFFVFVMQYKAASVALATSISSLFNCLFLIFFLSKKIQTIFYAKIWFSIFKTLLATVTSAGITIWIGLNYFQDPTWKLILRNKSIVFPRNFSDQFFDFFALAVIFGLLVLILAKVFRANELLKILKWRKDPDS